MKTYLTPTFDTVQCGHPASPVLSTQRAPCEQPDARLVVPSPVMIHPKRRSRRSRPAASRRRGDARLPAYRMGYTIGELIDMYRANPTPETWRDIQDAKAALESVRMKHRSP